MCLAILALQTLLVAATLTLLAHVRAWAIHEMATPRGRQQWNAWREAAERQANGSGPVRRRVPSSEEAPVVVLLRDHFAAVATGVTLFLSIIVWLTIGGLWASCRQGRRRGSPDTVVRPSAGARR